LREGSHAEELSYPAVLDLYLHERLLAWTYREREFIDRLCDEGEIAAELIADDPSVQILVRDQPLLPPAEGWPAGGLPSFHGAIA